MKLTPALKRSITRDWQSLALQFAIYKPMLLARRVGPLVQGIALDRDESNETYLPILFVHCLCRPFPGLSFTFPQDLLSPRALAPQRLKVQFHEQNFREACERLLASSLLPVSGDIHVTEIVAAISKGQKSRHWLYCLPEMESAVMLNAWLGEAIQAQDLLEKYIKQAEAWPELVLSREGGVSGWLRKLAGFISHPEELRAIAIDQAAKLKVDSLPQSLLLP